MPGYYDQLELQLARATESAPRLWLVPSPSPAQRDRMVGGVSIAIAAAVVAAVVGLGGLHNSTKPRGTTGNSGGLTVIRNYVPGRTPSMGGQLVCATTLTTSSGHGRAGGSITVNTRPPTGFEFSLRASRLRANAATSVYEMWMLPANFNSLKNTYSVAKGQPPLFVGVISPTVGSDGLIRAEGTLPDQVNGPYLLVITAGRQPSAHRLGRIVLRGFISL